MKTLETTPIFLTEEEARTFLDFQKYKGLIVLLESVGAFDLVSGKITIHFDAQGKIGSIDKQQYFRV